MRYELAGLGLCIGALLACGSSVGWSYERLTRDPKGDLVSVTCEDSQSQCYYAARYACSGDFTVQDAQSENGTTGAYRVGNAVFVKRDFTGAMLVRCAPRLAPAQVTASQ